MVGRMKPRDVFRIIVATAGLYLFITGASSLIGAVVSSIASAEGRHVATGYYAGVGVVQIALGILIMRGQPPLVDMAFPPEATPAAADEATKPDA